MSVVETPEQVAEQLDKLALGRGMQAGIGGYTGSCPDHSQTQSEGEAAYQHARKQLQQSKMDLIPQARWVKVPN